MSNRLTQAEKEYAKGRLSYAANLFRQVINDEPDNAEAYTGLSYCLSGMKHYALAVENSNIAIKLRPDMSRPHISLGYAYLMQGKSSEAESEYQTAVALHPESAANYLSLAVMYIYMGRLTDAEVVLVQALKVDPESADVYDTQSIVYNRLRMRDKAIHAAHMAFRYAPNFRSLHSLINQYIRKYLIYHVVLGMISLYLGIFAELPLAWGGLYAASYLMFGISNIFIEGMRKYALVRFVVLICYLFLRILVQGHFIRV